MPSKEDNSESWPDVEDIWYSLSLTTPYSRQPVSPVEWYEQMPFIFRKIIGCYVIIGLVIFGTFGNVLTLAVFRTYQKSSKSSATFLMQALSVVDTAYLLCLVPTKWLSNCYQFGLIR